MRVYLAGGINGLSDAAAKDWRMIAREVLSAVGIEILDPMARDYRGREAGLHCEIVESDITEILTCDVVLAMCERPSWGTAMELRIAWENGVRVIAVCSTATPSPWLVYHTHVVASLDEALALVVAGHQRKSSWA